jgi:hypothetical protein
MTVDYQFPTEGSRRLTLAVALLSSVIFVIALLSTGLAMLSHYYGLRVVDLGLAWPTMGVGGQRTTNEHTSSSGMIKYDLTGFDATMCFISLSFH